MEMKTVSENGIDVEGREAAKVVSPSLFQRTKGKGEASGRETGCFCGCPVLPFRSLC